MKVNIDVAGSGPSLIFSHGLAESSRSFGGQIGALRERWRVVAWDLPGHGASERTDDPSDYTRDAALRHLDALVRDCGEPPVLAGHSLGGYLSLAYAALHPRAVRGLVLLAAGPGYRDAEAREKWNKTVDRMIETSSLPAVVLALGKHTDDLVMRALPEIDVPVLVLVGELDVRYQGAATYMERKLPNAKLVTIPGGGHDMHERLPELVNAEIEAFLGSL